MKTNNEPYRIGGLEDEAIHTDAPLINARDAIRAVNIGLILGALVVLIGCLFF